MADPNILVHEVEYLAVSAAIIDPPSERRVVIVTIRPDLPAFRPHNLGIARCQAERLLANLQNLLSPE
jgi:hypothetical protein